MKIKSILIIIYLVGVVLNMIYFYFSPACVSSSASYVFGCNLGKSMLWFLNVIIWIKG